MSSEHFTNQTDQGTSGITRNEQILIAHVVLSLIPSLIAIPIGICLPCFARKIIPSAWFHLHWILQVIFSTIPIIVGFTIVHHFMEKSHYNWADKPHSVPFLMAFEVIFGAVYTTKCHVNKLRIVHKLLDTYYGASNNFFRHRTLGNCSILDLAFHCMGCIADYNLCCS
ncbi:22114_t:CDS:2 [Gigaspora rosea]|nr:22114_t:CDS:2 [Gigaspora rosea]